VPLNPGVRLGPYEVTALIREGGNRSRERRRTVTVTRWAPFELRFSAGSRNLLRRVMTVEETLEFFAHYHEAVAQRDWVTLAANYADDCVLESPSWGVITGRAEIERVFREYWAAFPDVVVENTPPIVAGDQVVQTRTVTGTDTGGFLGQAPTGRSFRMFLVAIFTLKDRKIVRERRVYDVGGLLLQLATDVRYNTTPVLGAAGVYLTTLETARHEHELKLAAEIQQALLPRGQYAGKGFEIAGASLPCRAIGGDFLDYYELPNGMFGFALGDVAGKGPPAALLAAQLQGILAAQSHAGGTPAETVTRVNQVLARRMIESRFATLIYGLLSCDGHLTYCNAGHNPPLLLGRQRLRRLERGGLVVGVFKEAIFSDETLELDPGDTLVVFSDGVTEALNATGAEFGEERLLSCVQEMHELKPAALLKSVLDIVHEFTAGTAQNDDVTVLVLRYTALSQAQRR
jgi:steroid delta-isomerase-like uncharacterized protein